MITHQQETPIHSLLHMLLNSKIHIPKIIHSILEKVVWLLLPLPLFMLITGTEGIIENESPENLASLSTLRSGLVDFLNMHTLIIFGAFGLTFMIWLITRKMWTPSVQDRHQSSDKTCNYSD